MLQFLEERLPDEISYGSKGGPRFQTSIYEAQSGDEQRNIHWNKARAEYDIQYGISDEKDMEEVTKFFYNVRGRAIAFRFKDWSDYTATNEVIAAGDGVATTFQMIKSYTVGAAIYVRKIFKPVDTTTVVSVNGTIDPTVTADITTGIVTFASPPANNDVITATFEFDVPVRFDVDYLPLTHATWQQQTGSGIKLKETRNNVT